MYKDRKRNGMQKLWTRQKVEKMKTNMKTHKQKPKP